MSDAQLRDLFTAARVDRRPQTTDKGDVETYGVEAWVAAFRQKRDEIAGRRCHDAWSTQAPPTFAVGPNLWLQADASPLRTRAANIISLFGYAPVALAFAVGLAFTVNLRAGAALLVLLAMSNMTASATKVVVSFPRPDAVDHRVVALADLRPGAVARRDWTFGGRVPRPPESAEDASDSGGFPSGHVTIATAFVLGLVFLFGWRAAWAGVLWIVPMAWARMYLGRHFLGDVLGGFGVAVIVTGICLLGLNLARLTHPARSGPVARRLIGAAAALAAFALTIHTPAPYDAGRLLGLALGIGLAVRMHGANMEAPALARIGRLVLAAACFGAAWWITATLLLRADGYETVAGSLIEGMVPAMVLLPGPLAIEEKFRAILRF